MNNIKQRFLFLLLVNASIVCFSAVTSAQVEGSAAADVQTTFNSEDLSSARDDVDSAPAGADDEEAIRASRFRSHNSWEGAVGGIHLVDAGSGPAGTFRLQLGIDFMSTSDFIAPGDVDDYLGGALSFSWSILDFLEAYLGLESHGNYNTNESPEFTQVLGDVLIGFKGFYPVIPWLTVGGDLRIKMLNTVGDLGLLSAATSFGLRGNVSADLQRLKSKVPLIARLNLGYFFDNSSELVTEIEEEELDQIMMRSNAPDSRDEEYRHLTSTADRFALGINRTDFFTLALGFEAPLLVSTDFYINPMLEWTWGIPVNRKSFECIEPYDDADLDSCLKLEGIGSFPMDMTLGARVLPPVKGLAVTLAVDFGLAGTSAFVRELAPNNPYKLMFALSYAYDTREPKPEIREVIRDLPVESVQAPKKGRIFGLILEKGAGTAVANATVTYVGLDLTPQLSSNDGRFVSYELEPGDVHLAISHPDYEAGKCSATIPAANAADQQSAAAPAPESEGSTAVATGEKPDAQTAGSGPAVAATLDVELRCELVAKPRQSAISGRVVGADRAAVSGVKIELSGPQTATLTSDAFGAFKLEAAPLGAYTARVESDGYFVKQQEFIVTEQGVPALEISLIAKPKNSMVSVSKREIYVRRRINFSKDGFSIEPRSEPLLAELADVLLRNPQIRLVEIQGHTDDRGGAQQNQELSQSQAEAIRNWLVQAGIPSERLEAKGYGQSRPIVPNLTPANRARNRRFQFIIKEQQ